VMREKLGEGAFGSKGEGNGGAVKKKNTATLSKLKAKGGVLKLQFEWAVTDAVGARAGQVGEDGIKS